MLITNDTTTYQVAELMGDQADERDGRIMLGILVREGYTDTDEIGTAKWEAFLAEVCKVRADEAEEARNFREFNND